MVLLEPGEEVTVVSQACVPNMFFEPGYSDKILICICTPSVSVLPR